MSETLTHGILSELATTKSWDKIITLTGMMSDADMQFAEYSFFRGLALMQEDRASEAVAAIGYGLSIEPLSPWGNRLLFDAHCAAGQTEAAFKYYAAYIEVKPGDEAEKAWYVEAAMEMGRLDLACAMNETRAVVRDVPPEPRYALGVQCFCKADTLDQVFASLMELKNAETFGLVILRDSIVNSPKAERYAPGMAGVEAVIAKWNHRLVSKFHSVEYLQNHRNMGTAPSCRRLLDHISKKFEGFLFIEDDCVLAPSALEWTEFHLNHSLSLEGRWFVSCESIFFDRKESHLEDALKERLVALSLVPELRNAYALFDFVPSTCFATTSEIWHLAAPFRSCTRGPETLNKYVKSKSIQTILPVVPHAADIGMLHELGYSVANLGVENVRERKGTYILADGIFDPSLCKPFDGNKDILYGATSKLLKNSVTVLENIYKLNEQ